MPGAIAIRAIVLAIIVAVAQIPSASAVANLTCGVLGEVPIFVLIAKRNAIAATRLAILPQHLAALASLA